MEGKLGKESHEEFARFFEAPTREGLREFLRKHQGEMDEVDFKEQWPTISKMARHVLAIANSGGGALIGGVKQEENGSFTPVGLEKLLDKAEMAQGLEKYLPSDIKHVLLDFLYADSEYPALKGKLFQVLIIEDDPKHLPFLAEADGEGLHAGAIYVRRDTKSEKASHDEVQTLINRRLSTGHSSARELVLRRHLDELRFLYREITPGEYHYVSPMSDLNNRLANLVPPMYRFSANPDFPSEKYDAFIARLIVQKKNLIQAFILASDHDSTIDRAR